MNSSASQRSLAASDLHAMQSSCSDRVIAAITLDVFDQNAFRILDLPTNSTQQVIQRQSQRLSFEAEFSDQIEFQDSGKLTSATITKASTIRAAKMRLEDPENRLVDEFFWFWPIDSKRPHADAALANVRAGKFSTAETLWIQLSEWDVRARHNLAVAKLFRAISNLRESDLGAEEQLQAWRDTGQCWQTLLRDDEIWQCLFERVPELDDPRLTVDFVPEFRKILPVALIWMLYAAAVEAMEHGRKSQALHLKRIASSYGFDPAIELDAATRVLMPIWARIRQSAADAEEQADLRPCEAHHSAQRLLESNQVSLEVFDLLLPAGHPLRTNAHDEVALRTMACETTYLNASDDWKTGKLLLSSLVEVAESESARGKIKETYLFVEQREVSSQCWFCHRRPGVRERSREVILRKREAKGTPAGKTRTVFVPRCASCHENHRKFGLSARVSFGVAGTLGALMVGLLLFSTVNSVSITLLGSVIAFFPAAFTGFNISRLLLVNAMDKSVKHQTQVHAFPQIAEALATGWRAGYGVKPIGLLLNE
jgi:hypothetical protein